MKTLLIVLVALFLLLALAASCYASAQAVVYEITLRSCIQHKFAHAEITYDFGRYCSTIYQSDEIIAPLDVIIKLDAGTAPPF